MAAAAAVALTLFTVGPWAASGFAQNPISQVFDFVGEHAGVQGVDEPPPTQVPVRLPSETVSPQEAAERLGISVRRMQMLLQMDERLRDLPLTSAAFVRGRISSSQVRLLLRVATPETEARLLAVMRIFGRRRVAAEVG